ncbi:unnamed protein product [Cylindrotheca closterium]|uniref:Circumsporozoite protein n=1 Tax=Cylindrotheca closterium TaxID=2856 RepID=A0AAD2FJH4_9STRA|nr:unnamed protein product [Cylindrotheca closterium]
MSTNSSDESPRQIEKGEETELKRPPSNNREVNIKTGAGSLTDENVGQGSTPPERREQLQRSSSRSPNGKHSSSRHLSSRRSSHDKDRTRPSERKSTKSSGDKHSSSRHLSSSSSNDKQNRSERISKDGSYDRRRDSRRSSNRSSRRKHMSERELSTPQHKRKSSLEGEPGVPYYDRQYDSKRKSSRHLSEKNSSERELRRSPHKWSSERELSRSHRRSSESNQRLSSRRFDTKSCTKPTSDHVERDIHERRRSKGSSPHPRSQRDGDDPYHHSIASPPFSTGQDLRSAILLYETDDTDAKAKEKSRRGGSERVVTPGIEHTSSNSSAAVSMLYGDNTDTDAKAKDKLRRGGSERVLNPGIEHISSNSRAAVSTLYGDDKDAAAKAKAKASRSGGAAMFSPSAGTNSSTKSIATINTLYGQDEDFKAKAKASRGSSELASIPGVESIALNSTHTSVSTLYGNEADSKAKTRAASGGSEIASNPGVESVNYDESVASTVDTLYGNDDDVKAKARASRGTPKFASSRGMGNAATGMPSLTESIPAESVSSSENDVEEPVARRVSIGSTESGRSRNSNPEREIDCGANGVPSAAMGALQIPNDPNAARVQDPDKKKGAEEEKEKSKKKPFLLFFSLLFLIGGGAAIWYFLFRNGDTSNENPQINPSNIQDPSSAPSPPGLATVTPVVPLASSSPSMFPSSLPTKGMLYERLNESDCEAIARNQTISGREQKENANFGLDLEVVLSDNATMTEPLVEQLLDAIQEKILPSLAGCSIIVDRFLEDWRFVIFDAFVKGSVQPEETCYDAELQGQNCHRVYAELALFLKGKVRFLDIIRLISDEKDNFSNDLGLSDQFLFVNLFRAEGLTPTVPPTMLPSNTPSLTPSQAPTGKPTPTPTSVASKAPTIFPTGEGSRSPTLVPSLEPSLMPSTGSPSWNPSLQPTEVPTESPSAEPSSVFSRSPTLLPTRDPSGRPTMNPSTAPTARPSKPPTMAPSPQPSAVPTSVPSAPPTASLVPSVKPSSIPSLIPSLEPSRLPSSAPSSQPSVATFFWAPCGRVGRCSPASSVQNSNYIRFNGTPAGRQIGIRCCSDIALPRFRQNGATCPYADSEIDGVCYDSVTWFEAVTLCSSIGARLCTKTELEDNCTRGTGCNHDNRYSWSSTPGP